MKKIKMGLGVLVLKEFPLTGGGYSEIPERIKMFQDGVKEIVGHKYILAITANKWQMDAALFLKQEGFRVVKTFQSNHGGGETLTIWIKIYKDYVDNPKEATGAYDWNCSITFAQEYPVPRICLFTIADPEKEDKILKEKKNKRIKNTPIYFVIKDGYERDTPKEYLDEKA